MKNVMKSEVVWSADLLARSFSLARLPFVCLLLAGQLLRQGSFLNVTG